MEKSLKMLCAPWKGSTFPCFAVYLHACKQHITARFPGMKWPALKRRDPNCQHFPRGDTNIIYAQGMEAKTNYSAHKREQLFYMPPNYRRHLKSWDCRDASPAMQLLLSETRSGCGQFYSRGSRQEEAGGVGMHRAAWNYHLQCKSESAAKSQQRGREIGEKGISCQKQDSGLRTKRSRVKERKKKRDSESGGKNHLQTPEG